MINFIIKIASNAFKLGGANLILVFFLIILSTIVELLGISLIIPIISIFLDPNNIEEYRLLINFKFLDNFNFLNVVLASFFLIFIIKYIITIFAEYLIVKYSKKWEINLIIKLINYHFKRPWIESLKNHELLIKNIFTDIPVFIVQGITGVLNIIKCLLILSGIFIYLIYSKGVITIIIFSIFSIIFFIFLKSFKNFLAGVSKKYGSFMDVKFNLTSEITNGFREIKIHNLRKYFLDEYLTNENSIARVDIIKKLTQILPKIIVELVCIFGFLLVVVSNSSNPENIIPFLGLLTFIIYRSQPLLTSLATLTAGLQLHSVQINEGINIFNLSKQIKYTKENNNEIDVNTDSNSIIEINDLDFSYENNTSERKIFSNLNLKLKFGNIYGLSGKNGTGKSTFADLVIGLLTPQKGSIFLDGKNINSFPNSWINSVSYLSQNYFLFNDTIKNNITLGTKTNDKFHEERYFKALEISNLKEEFDKFTNKDNSILRNAGRNLSGGQKQRIAIARLIYKNSKVVILDEPTASLDQDSSKLMIEMLKEIKKEKLIIVISHSEELLNQCDNILVLGNKDIDLKSND
jgi:ATP-binding cassette, subfamily B, bacterial PglK